MPHKKVLVLLGTAFFMVILDATIVLTAIPSIGQELSLSDSEVQWVATAYALVFGGLMLFCGRVADLMGRRRVFMAGLALFVLSSLVCGLSWSAWVLIAARSVQGLSAAIMAPTALSIVTTTFTEGAERNRALGIWGGLGGVGATAGLLVGGVITSSVGWEWIFFVNVPIGLTLLALSPIVLPESRDTSRARKFDAAGAVTITVALLAIVYAVFRVPEVGWASVQTSGLLAAGAALVALFVFIESRAESPLVPLRILRMRTLVGGNVVIFAIGMAVDAMLFTLTLFAQHVLGYSAVQFGLMTAAMTVMSIVGAMAGQSLVNRLGLRAVAMASLVLIGTGCVLLIGLRVDATFVRDLLPGLLVFGPGMGAAFVSSQIAALTGVADEESGLASGLVDTSFNMGSALGIAIAASVAVSRTGGIGVAEGYRFALLTTIAFVVLGLLGAILLPKATRITQPLS